MDPKQNNQAEKEARVTTVEASIHTSKMDKKPGDGAEALDDQKSIDKTLNFNINIDDFLRLSRQLIVSIPEDLQDTFENHKVNLDADLQKMLSHELSQTYEAKGKELKKSIDNLHNNLYSKAWQENDETIERDLVKIIQSHKDDDAKVIRVKVPQRLAGTYKDHKSDMKTEVKDDVLHILEDYEADDEEELKYFLP